jgi:hypothetical protein
MPRGETAVSTTDYIIKVAEATDKNIWQGLCFYLYLSFVKTEGEDFASDLAIGTANLVLGRRPADSKVAEFGQQNQARIEREARNLNQDRDLCELLSGAAYNTGYGIYVASGGSRLFNRFLQFIREDRKADSQSAFQKLEQLGGQLPATSPEPIWRLRRLGLWIPRDYSPNELDHLKAIQAFAARQSELVNQTEKKQ